jgi:hypothetical protein
MNEWHSRYKLQGPVIAINLVTLLRVRAVQTHPDHF